MSDKVREIRIHEPNQDLVDYAELLLKDAKSGKLQAIAGVVVFDNGNTADIWISAPKGHPLALQSDRMIGCLERIKFQLIAHRHGIETEDSFGEPDESA